MSRKRLDSAFADARAILSNPDVPIAGTLRADAMGTSRHPPGAITCGFSLTGLFVYRHL
jgi:hypothetical protein